MSNEYEESSAIGEDEENLEENISDSESTSPQKESTDFEESKQLPIIPIVPTQKPKKAKSGKPKVKKPKLIVNVFNTQYDVVKEVNKKTMKYKLSMLPFTAEWDLYWADTGVTNEMLTKMKLYQKINHYPSMGCLARKNNLGKNLMRMRKLFPKDYNFFPPTWLLPVEYSDFRAQFEKGKAKTFIAKPEALSQGKGIFLLRHPDDVPANEHYVVQRYIRKPYLIEGLKFDLRIYVLVYGCDPLRIYIFKEGLARLATEEYQAPTSENMDNLYIHLTNYAINKNSDNFIFNTDPNRADIGHKRSLTYIWDYLDKHGGNSRELQRKIRRAIVKTLCAVQPQLAHSYRSCQPNDTENNMCFEILGFDILLDHKLKPWLLEVNHSPSFTTDTPFDHKVKHELLHDVLKLVHMDVNNRLKFYQKKQEEQNLRAIGKYKPLKISKEEREEMRKKAMQERDEYEMSHLGGFTRIYPDSKMDEKYESFIEAAEKSWQEFYGFKKKNSGSEDPKKATKPPIAKNKPNSKIQTIQNIRKTPVLTAEKGRLRSNSKAQPTGSLLSASLIKGNRERSLTHMSSACQPEDPENLINIPIPPVVLQPEQIKEIPKSIFLIKN